MHRHRRHLALQPLEPRHMLAAALVDTELDVVDPLDGHTSLREALSTANSQNGLDTIQFSPALSGKVLLLRHGELPITDDLVISGLGLDQFGIDASGNDPTPNQNNADGSRIFNIDDGNPDHNINVTLEGLLLFGGDVAGRGGAVYSTENLILRSSRITSNAADFSGGGVYIRTMPGGSAAIYDSVINVNFTTGTTFNGSGYGGGAYITARADSRVTIANTQFSNNSANKKTASGGSGGGLYAIAWQTAEIHIRNSTISGNTAVQRGGGIYARSFNDSRLDLQSLTITGNRGDFGAGAMLVSNDSSSARISGSLIQENRTNGTFGRGGGLHVISTGASNLTVAYSTISDNDGRSGSGIYANANNSSTLMLDSLLVRRNTISSQQPSAENLGGGILARSDHEGQLIIASSTISNNLASGVSSGGGGGIATAAFDDGSVTIVSSTIVVNQTTKSGGGIWHANGNPPILKHTIVASNSASLPGDDIGGEVHADWSLVEDSAGATIVGANNLLDVDPILTGIDDNGGPTLTFAPRFDSPAINAGDPAAAAGLAGSPLFDQRGASHLRVAGGRIDIGAVEIQTAVPPLPGDYNNSGSVDTADYVVWRRNLSQNTTAFAGADGNGDAIINEPDYQIWRANFGATSSPPAAPAASAPTTSAPPTSASTASAPRAEALALAVRPSIALSRVTRPKIAAGENLELSENDLLVLALAKASIDSVAVTDDHLGPAESAESAASFPESAMRPARLAASLARLAACSR
jgi:hypothetical protein